MADVLGHALVTKLKRMATQYERAPPLREVLRGDLAQR